MLEYVLIALVAAQNVALVVFMIRLRTPVQVFIPPPVTQLSAETHALLNRLDERVKPLPLPPMAPDVAENLIVSAVRDSVAVAEQMAISNKKAGNLVSGAEKQREAMRVALLRLKTLGIEVHPSTLAHRIEAEVHAVAEKKE